MGNEFTEVIDRLVRHEHGPRISILTEADATGLDLARARIAAKDAIDVAVGALNELATADGLAGSLRMLTARVQDPRFWSHHRAPGVGIFVAPGLEEIVDLPSAPHPCASVGLVFRILELCAAAQQPEHLVLAISNGRARAFRLSPGGVVTLDVSGMPDDLDEVAKFADIEATLQHHAGARGGSTMFHGQESGTRQMDHLRERYLRLIDQAILDSAGLSSLPVVLAGVDEITVAYREISRLPYLVTSTIPGNHDRSSPAEIMGLSRLLIDPESLDPVRARDRASSQDDMRRVVTDPRRVFHAAEEGRVEAVFLPPARDCHGLALDEIAAAVHRNGGRVWIEGETVPAENVTALLRF